MNNEIERDAYEQCFKEAEALCKDGFSPAIDDLEEEKIGHILFKVLNEHDVISEGHLQEIDYEVDQAAMKEAEVFMAKWVDYIEPEFGHEREMYLPFKRSLKAHEIEF